MLTLSERAQQILNDPLRISQRNAWFDRLRGLYAGRRDEHLQKRPFVLHGILGGNTLAVENNSIAYTEPEEWIYARLNDLASQIEAWPLSPEECFSPVCVEYGIYGVHFIDKILGADVFYQDDQWNAHYLTNPIGELPEPDLDNDPTWNLAKRAALAFVQSGVKLPLFGMPTLSSALNIAVNLYGEECLVAMLLEPEAIRHDLDIIQNTIVSLHRWYRENIPATQLQPVISWDRTQPPEYGQLCGCTTQLLSGPTYAEFIAPLDNALLSEYPNGGMIHFCGGHTQHIETFRNMPALKALQLNDRAAGDLEEYFKGLREDQILYVNPCKEMPIERALEITGGHRLVLCTDPRNVPSLS